MRRAPRDATGTVRLSRPHCPAASSAVPTAARDRRRRGRRADRLTRICASSRTPPQRHDKHGRRAFDALAARPRNVYVCLPYALPTAAAAASPSAMMMMPTAAAARWRAREEERDADDEAYRKEHRPEVCLVRPRRCRGAVCTASRACCPRWRAAGRIAAQYHFVKRKSVGIIHRPTATWTILRVNSSP